VQGKNNISNGRKKLNQVNRTRELNKIGRGRNQNKNVAPEPLQTSNRWPAKAMCLPGQSLQHQLISQNFSF
jgi:hypothetical protein